MTLLSPRRPQVEPVGRSATGRAGRRTAPVAPPETVQTPLAAGIGAALWSAALGLGLTTAAVLGTWASGGRESGGARGALVAGAQGWLLGNGTDLRLEHGSLTLAPLGLMLVFAALLFRSGVWAGRAAMVQTLREAATATACLLTVYLAIAVGVAIAARSPGVTPTPPTALTGSAGLALVAGGGGVLRGSDLVGSALDLFPEDVRLALRGAVGATLTLLLGGAVVLAASLVWHVHDVAHLYSSLGVDTVGSIELIALCLAYAPVGAVWAMTYCLGPGFAVGTGTLVAPSGTSLGDLPAFPLLGALPSEGPAPGLALAGLAVPVVAGIVLGVLVARKSLQGPVQAAGVGVGAAGLAGVFVGLLAVLAHGGLTQGRMSTLGPNPLVIALWTCAELAAVGGLTAGEYRRQSLGRAARRARAAIPLPEPSTVVLPGPVVLPETVPEGPGAEPSSDGG